MPIKELISTSRSCSRNSQKKSTVPTEEPIINYINLSTKDLY